MKIDNGKKKIIIVAVTIIALIIIVVAIVNSNSSLDSGDNYSYKDGLDTMQENSNDLNHISEVPDGYIGIYTSEDLQNITLNTTANYIVMNDIDLNGSSFSSIEQFTGVFNGNNYEIRNYNSDCSMFKEIANATIENIHFTNAVIDRRNSNKEDISIGGIVGKDSFKTNNSIQNCTYQGEIIAKSSLKKQSGTDSIGFGGIVGMCYSNTSVESCTFNGTIRVEEGYVDDVGGIVGYLGEYCSPISNCYSIGKIISDEVLYLGGICGSSDVDINNCYSTCVIDVNSKADCIGGIVGHIYNGEVKSTYYIGSINSAADKFGAIVGAVYSDYDTVNQIQYCYYSSEKLDAVGDGKPYANVQKLSLDEMKKKDNFTGFDFDSKWRMGNKDYPYPVLSGSSYKFSNLNYTDILADVDNKGDTNKKYNISDIEYAFKQSIINNSVDEIKPYFYPKADEILKNAQSKGQDNSVLADMNCVLDDFYYDETHPLGKNVEIKKGHIDSSDTKELTDSIINDIHDIDKSVNIQSIEYSEFEYSTDTYDLNCMLIILKTDNGAYLLAIA